MNLPGLAHNTSTEESQNIVNLSPFSEWRYEVGFHESIKVTVTEGLAELFGTELVVGESYNFTSTKGAIFTYTGAIIKWTGECVEYTSDDHESSNFMKTILYLNFALEKSRILSKENPSHNKAPRVLVVGAQDSGKTSLCKILTGYANKRGFQPLYVNLDPSEGAFSVPGTLSATPISDILDVEKTEGWGDSYTTSVTPIHMKQPLCYWYGFESPKDNLAVYKKLCERLSIVVASRLEEDKEVGSSGIIVDTSGIIDKDTGYDLITNIVSDYEINLLLVLGNERLFASLSKKFKAKKQNLTCLKLPKSGGVVDRDDKFTRAVQRKMIGEYFYGSPVKMGMGLSPYSITVDYNDMTIYKSSQQTDLGLSSVLPIGESDIDSSSNETDLISLVEVSSSALSNCILAVLYAEPSDSRITILQSPVMGFVHIVECDDAKRKLKVLLPMPGRLPTKVFMLGGYRYQE